MESTEVAVVETMGVSSVLMGDLETKRQSAIELDGKIDSAIDRLGRDVAKSYIAIGKDLAEMKETDGYQLLGCVTWGEYLASKHSRLKKTYCYYAMRLAEAEGLDSYYEVLNGAQFIEYSKLVKGDKIPQLMADTAEAVKGLSARETAKRLASHIAENPGKYRRDTEGRKATSGRAPAPWDQKFAKQLEAAKDKDAFIEGMKVFLKSLRTAEN